MPTLQLQDVRVEIGPTPILRGVSLSIDRGKTLGVVGESGCGKSMTGLATMGMLPPRGRVSSGRILLDHRELQGLSEREWRQIRGKQIGMVMQDPFASLNPMMRVGDQIAETLMLHLGKSKHVARSEAIDWMRKVGIPSPESSWRKFPHQMSGGQRQRIVIAIAFACRPTALIADEPTTALDVSLQAQILRLLRELQEEVGTAVMLISHDIGVIASLADDIAVYYAGRVVEKGPASAVLRNPKHPYTAALLAALPNPARDRLDAISGQPPSLSKLPAGCAFAPRCRSAFQECVKDPMPIQLEPQELVECWLYKG